MGCTAQPSRGCQNTHIHAACPRSQGYIRHVMSDICTFTLRGWLYKRSQPPTPARTTSWMLPSTCGPQGPSPVLKQSWRTLRLPRAKEIWSYDGNSSFGDVHEIIMIRPQLSSLISPWENQGVQHYFQENIYKKHSQTLLKSLSKCWNTYIQCMGSHCLKNKI